MEKTEINQKAASSLDWDSTSPIDGEVSGPSDTSDSVQAYRHDRLRRDPPSLGLKVLSIGLTVTSLSISILAGWQRGGWLSERLVWIAISVMLVLCAHLLPALCHSAPKTARRVAVGLWIACMTVVSYGHATFFLLSQQHAGERRADAITIAAGPSRPVILRGRSLVLIAEDQAKVHAELAMANLPNCRTSCTALRAKREGLTAKLDALGVEAEEAKRWEAAEDRGVVQAERATVMRDSVRGDPVTARLAGGSGVTAERFDLLLAVVFAIVIEGIASLCWYLGLDAHGVTADAVTPDATASRRPVSNDIEPARQLGISQDCSTERDSAVEKLRQDIVEGRVRRTVADIRRHLGCSQARASALRRLVNEQQMCP